jgi:anti-sigma B factor antagonist
MKSSEHDNDRSDRGSRPIMRRPTRYRLDKKINGICIFEVVGRLAPSTADEELCARIDDLIAGGNVNFLLDLQGVSYISSTGVGSLIQCYHHAERAGGKLKILTPSQAVSQILSVSKLDSIFEVHHNEDEAIRSFGGDIAASEPVIEDEPPTLIPNAPATPFPLPKAVPARAAAPFRAPTPAPVAAAPAPTPTAPAGPPQARVVKAADAPPIKKPRSRRAKSEA